MSCPTYTNTTFETTYAQNQDKVVAYQMYDKTSAFCLTAKKALRDRAQTTYALCNDGEGGSNCTYVSTLVDF